MWLRGSVDGVFYIVEAEKIPGRTVEYERHQPQDIE